jgi:hypothetical protein
MANARVEVELCEIHAQEGTENKSITVRGNSIVSFTETEKRLNVGFRVNTTLNFSYAGGLWSDRLRSIEEATQTASIYPEGQDEVVIPFAFDVQLDMESFKYELEHGLLEHVVRRDIPLEAITDRLTFSMERNISVNAIPDIGTGSSGSSQDFEGATQELQPLWTEMVSQIASRYR